MNSNIRETREGWPLLTVETEANGDSKSTNEKGPSLVGSLGSRVPVQEIFISCIGCSSRPSTKYVNLGRQSCWVACLLVCVPIEQIDAKRISTTRVIET
jgi:hypothetical protein